MTPKLGIPFDAYERDLIAEAAKFKGSRVTATGFVQWAAIEKAREVLKQRDQEWARKQVMEGKSYDSSTKMLPPEGATA